MKVKYIIIILVINYVLATFFGGILETVVLGNRAKEVATLIRSAGDMALEQTQLIDDYMAYGDRDSYTMMVTSKNGQGFMAEDTFEAVWGINSLVSSNRESIFAKMYQTPELAALAGRVGPMRKPLRYYNNPSNPDQVMAWYTVPTLAMMGLDVLPNVQAVRGIKRDGAYVSPEVADKLFTDYDYNSHIKTTGGYEYYNTPVNLGVTYLNPEFLGTLFINNVDLTMRRKYTANLNTPEGGNGILKGTTFANSISGNLSAYNPINNGDFSVLRGAANPTTSEGVTFKGVTPKIEYKVIDMYDSRNDTMLATLFGANKGSTGSKSQYLKELDSHVINPSTGMPYDKKPIVVAKVSFYMDVVIPYYTLIARDFQAEFGNTGDNFIQLEDTRKEGMGGSRRFVYTRYFAVAP